ncbi:MAG: FAD-dependent oxidoreductase [Betaproteobacteria bacterium]|nr:MAG: FAD-dependent oxidoreductase [Betaproteobacteria bacterium]
MRIAVVGAGISGLASAFYLQRAGHSVSLLEANAYFGGHTATVDVELDGLRSGVDTGFLVCNDRTYPGLLALFSELDVALANSEMSFAVRADRDGIEWSGCSLATLFAQPKNLVNPKFLRFLADIVRFNRLTTAMVNEGRVASMSLRQFLAEHRFGSALFDWYLWPMVGSIWSSPRNDVMDFDLQMLLRFCHNHGLLQISNRPQWMTVRGGARNYVEKIVATLKDARLKTPVRSITRSGSGVQVQVDSGIEVFDRVVMACHSDQALAMLAAPSAVERAQLSAVAYQPNRCVLHTDETLMPRSRRAWAAWNYLQVDDVNGVRPVALTYWLNRLQPLPFKTQLFETLNPPLEPSAEKVIAEFEYSHPLLNRAAVAAQSAVASIQGDNNTYYAGAWLANGFHEDGLQSALRVVAMISSEANQTKGANAQ